MADNLNPISHNPLLTDIAHYFDRIGFLVPIPALLLDFGNTISGSILLLFALFFVKGIPIYIWGVDTKKDVSAHMSFLVLMSLIMVDSLGVISLVVLAPLTVGITFSRLWLQAHNIYTTYLGFSLGVGIYILI